MISDFCSWSLTIPYALQIIGKSTRKDIFRKRWKESVTIFKKCRGGMEGYVQIHISNCLWGERGNRSRKGNNTYFIYVLFLSIKKKIGNKYAKMLTSANWDEGHLVFLMFSLLVSVS